MENARRAFAPAIDLAREEDFRLGSLRISPSTREVRADGMCETVEPRVMQALVRLARAEGGVVSRDDLIQSCWGGRAVGEDAINRCIAKVRQLADLAGRDSFVIETIPRVGYRLECAVEGASSESEAAPGPSICVLPFANMSDDPQQEYFADGITEDIITDLSRVSSLFVVARNTAFMFKGQHVDIQQVSKQLCVSHVLEGSVRKSGNRVRITAQLVDGRSGGHLWADRYDRDLKDIFSVQDEISHAIVKALRLKLVSSEDQVIGRRGTGNADAYRLYLMARQKFIQGATCEHRTAETIVRLCTRATELDPNYAQAWALLGMGQFYAPAKGDGGLQAAQRALALDPSLADAHAILAKIQIEERRDEDAEAEIAIALRLDPESYIVNRVAGYLEYRRKRPEMAARYWEKAMEMETDTWAVICLISCYKAMDDVESMRRVAQVTLARCEKVLAGDPNNGSALALSVYAYAALGDADKARDRAELALLIDPENVNMRYNIGCVYSVFLNDIDGAFELLEPVFAQMKQSFVDHTKDDPDLEPLRRDPRFWSLVEAAEERLTREAGPETQAA